MKLQFVIPLFVFLFILISPAYATTIDYTHNKQDTFDRQADPDTNYGTEDNMVLMVYKTFNESLYMQWDVGDIPSGSTIVSAYLSLWQYASGGTGDTTIKVYNTSLNWNETNVTYNAQPTLGVLTESTVVNLFAGQWKNITVTSALQHAVDVSAYMSIKINGTAPATRQAMFYTKEYASTSKRPFLTVTYNVTDCATKCGDCGCINETLECKVPPIIGSYCAVDDGLPNSIKTVLYSNCTGTTYMACPNGTVCNQVSPVVNTTLYPVNVPGEATIPYCHQCIFMNMKLNTQFASTYKWINVWTNCPDNPECNCMDYYCSNNIYTAPTITDVPYNMTTWAAGCFNPTSGYWVNITNSTGGQTTIDDLVNESCGSACTIGNNTPQTECPLNTTTSCYNSACSPVQCPGTPTSQCSANIGGQAALSIGALVGVTDCGLSQNIIALLASIFIGFLLLFYTKDSQHSGQAFIFGTVIMLVLFTLIAWFPSWLMVMLMVLSAYIVAKSVGIAG